MSRIVLCLAFVSALFGPVANAECIQWAGPPFNNCLAYRPDLPPGWVHCDGQTSAASGEFVMWTGTNYTGYCIKTTGTINVDNFVTYHMNDWINSVQNKHSGSVINLYKDINFGGGGYAVWFGQNVPDLTSFGPSSVKQ